MSVMRSPEYSFQATASVWSRVDDELAALDLEGLAGVVLRRVQGPAVGEGVAPQVGAVVGVAVAVGPGADIAEGPVDHPGQLQHLVGPHQVDRVVAQAHADRAPVLLVGPEHLAVAAPLTAGAVWQGVRPGGHLPLALEVGVDPGLGVGVGVVVVGVEVHPVEHREDGRSLVQQRRVHLSHAVGQDLVHGVEVGPPARRVVVRVHQRAVRMAGAVEVGAEVDPVVALVVHPELEVFDLEAVAQWAGVHEVALHPVGDLAVGEHAGPADLVEAGVAAVGVEHRGQAVPLAGDALLPLGGLGVGHVVSSGAPLSGATVSGLRSGGWCGCRRSRPGRAGGPPGPIPDRRRG